MVKRYADHERYRGIQPNHFRPFTGAAVQEAIYSLIMQQRGFMLLRQYHADPEAEVHSEPTTAIATGCPLRMAAPMLWLVSRSTAKGWLSKSSSKPEVHRWLQPPRMGTISSACFG
ncbi:MAG: hypothetical protein ACE37N_14985 [Pseudohongiellaceae bacterium]